ncbi:MAG: CarD family transcriptional regulator [Eubacteriales bacterium]|jgi:CarD family transcriptional regulator
MFQINDIIIYGTEGVCKIDDISEKRIDDKTMEYYVLKPLYQNRAVVYVPKNSKKLTSRMRNVLTLYEVNELIREFANIDSIDIADTRARKQTYQQILQTCDYRELTRLVKTLHYQRLEAEEGGKKLPMWEDRVRKEAEKVLFSEFAYVLKIEPEQVLEYIESMTKS